MMYREIECPTCGNDVMAESSKLPQKCPWCRRLFKVSWEKQGKKYFWTAQNAEFSRPNKSFSKFDMSQEGLRGYEESAVTNEEPPSGDWDNEDWENYQ